MGREWSGTESGMSQAGNRKGMMKGNDDRGGERSDVSDLSNTDGSLEEGTSGFGVG